jgi:ribose 1,5-bisphosphokinase PhnN
VLVLLCGSSGVGRSECLARLTAEYGWATVPWLTTRAPRDGERDRIPVSRASFEDQHDAGKIFYRFEFHGAHYGILAEDVQRAVDGGNAKLCGTDVLPSSLEAFDSVPRVAIGIRANVPDLRSRLTAVGRQNRQESASRESDLLLQDQVIRRIDEFLTSRQDMLAELASEMAGLPYHDLLARRSTRYDEDESGLRSSF